MAVGDWGSVYVTAGATVATFIGQITAVAAGVNGAVTFSTTRKSGTFPAASAGAHTITLKTGGAYKGPNGTVSFPYGFIAATQTNVAGDTPRVNFKNGVNYAITAAMTHGVAGPVQFQGYTSSAGDGGRATIDGTIVGASYALLTLSGIQAVSQDLIFQNNGTTGSANGVLLSGQQAVMRRCVFNNIRGNGVSTGTTGISLVECEAYTCNQSNTASLSGIALNNNGCLALRCIAHDNAGSNTNGFGISGHSTLDHCVADTNGFNGVQVLLAAIANLVNVDCYNNVASGLAVGTSGVNAAVYAENCNFILNGIYGVSAAGTGTRAGYIVNCGFGSGTQANTSGTTNSLGAIQVIGSITYAANLTPWVDPANGDFRINLAAAQGTGRGTFTQTAASYAGSVGYPDIGAAQSQPRPVGSSLIVQSSGVY